MEPLEEPRLLQTARGHRGEVTCAEACGGWLATGGGDRALRLWRWEPGEGWREAAAARAAHRYGVTAVRWSAGGAALASGGVDGCARLWSGRSLAPRGLLAAPGAAGLRALCWAGAGAGGGRLLGGHDDGALRVWDARRGRLEAELRAHDGALHAVAAPADGALLLTACTDGVLKVFDLAEVCRAGRAGAASPAPLTWEDGAHDLGVLCAAAGGRHAAADGLLAATGGQDARVRLWRAAGGGLRPAGALEGHAAPVTGLCWQGALLASASLDRTARLWAPAARACLHVLHAHDRYLTCVHLDRDLRYMITGSNDKSVRMWSLGALRLADELDPPCAALTHFGIGDLEGIEAVECDDDFDEAAATRAEGGEGGEGGARRVWHSRDLHSAAVNCISTQDTLLATASSDGVVRVLRWCAALEEAVAEREVCARRYPRTAVHLAARGAAGALLLAASLDGRACLHDVQTGVELRSLSMPYREDAGEAGGGGVRDARISPHHPPLLLLATDDGLAAVWSVADANPNPSHVYESLGEAATCCAWSRDGRVAAVGAAGGELRLLAPPPAARTLRARLDAHDLGVQSCDFASASGALGLGEREYLLATAGCDSTLKLWLVEFKEDSGDSEAARMEEVHSVWAHGGGGAAVRWGADGRLASAGADRWARVWRARRRGAQLQLLAAVPAPGAGGALAAALLAPALLAVGSLDGELTLWRLRLGSDSDDAEDDDAEGADPRFWGEAGVVRWLREYVTRAPGSGAAREAEGQLCQRARRACLTGAGLLEEPLDSLLDALGCGTRGGVEGETEEGVGSWSDEVREAVRSRLVDELLWLRTELPEHVERSAPHALRCPLTHRVAREPASAADGYTYERSALLEWLFLDENSVSPMSGRRMRNSRVVPNHRARAALRLYMSDDGRDLRDHPQDLSGTQQDLGEQQQELSEQQQELSAQQQELSDEQPEPT